MFQINKLLSLNTIISILLARYNKNIFLFSFLLNHLTIIIIIFLNNYKIQAETNYFKL